MKPPSNPTTGIAIINTIGNAPGVPPNMPPISETILPVKATVVTRVAITITKTGPTQSGVPAIA